MSDKAIDTILKYCLKCLLFPTHPLHMEANQFLSAKMAFIQSQQKTKIIIYLSFDCFYSLFTFYLNIFYRPCGLIIKYSSLFKIHINPPYVILNNCFLITYYIHYNFYWSDHTFKQILIINVFFYLYIRQKTSSVLEKFSTITIVVRSSGVSDVIMNFNINCF